MNKFKSLLRFWVSGPDRETIKDSAQIDESFKKYRKQVLTSLTLGYGAYYVCRLALSVIKKPLIDNGVFNPAELGKIGAAFFYAYAIGKFTNGFLADHSNARKFMATGLFLSALCNIAMGCSTALSVFIVVWALNGWFQSFGAVSSVVALSHWTSNSERGSFYGIWSSAHSIGEGLTFIGTVILVEHYGWRSGFAGTGVFCLLASILLLVFMKDRPRTLGLPTVDRWRNDDPPASEPVTQNPAISGGKDILANQLRIFRNPAVWVLCLASATMYITRYAVNSWGILYLQEARGMSLKSAGVLLAINTFAGIGGSVAYGLISDKLFHARRPPVNLIFAVLEIISLLVIFCLPTTSYLVLALAFAVYGFALNGLLTVLGGLFAIDVVSKKASGAILGFIGIFSYLAAALQEQISGWLIGRNTYEIGGILRYDFSQPIIFWVGMSVVSMALAASLWKTKNAN